MSFLSGRVHGTRYVIADWSTHKNPTRDTVEGALKEYAFREPLSKSNEGLHIGWVEMDDWMNTAFTPDAWTAGAYLAFTLRTDRKVVPGKLLAAHLRRRVAAWCAEHQRERCPSTVKSEIKDSLKRELLETTHPTTKLVPMVWNLEDGAVTIDSTAETALETARKFFQRTFGLTLRRAEPLRDIDLEEAWVLRYGRKRNLDETSIPEDEGTLDEEKLSDFLTWLWYVAAVDDGDVSEEMNIELIGRLCFRDPGQGAHSVVVAADGFERIAESKEALKAGRRLHELRLSLTEPGTANLYGLTLAGPHLEIQGLKFSHLCKGDFEDSVLETMYLLEHVQGLVATMLGVYASLVASGAWVREVQPKIRAWADAPMVSPDTASEPG